MKMDENVLAVKCRREASLQAEWEQAQQSNQPYKDPLKDGGCLTLKSAPGQSAKEIRNGYSERKGPISSTEIHWLIM